MSASLSRKLLLCSDIDFIHKLKNPPPTAPTIPIITTGLQLNLDAATGISGSTWTDSSPNKYNHTSYVGTSSSWSGTPSTIVNFPTTTVNGYTVVNFTGSNYNFDY